MSRLPSPTRTDQRTKPIEIVQTPSFFDYTRLTGERVVLCILDLHADVGVGDGVAVEDIVLGAAVVAGHKGLVASFVRVQSILNNQKPTTAIIRGMSIQHVGHMHPSQYHLTYKHWLGFLLHDRGGGRI